MDSSNIPKRDAFMRLNYIYQAAHTLLKINPNNTSLVQYYGTIFKSISRKNVLRVSPDIKRTWCKKCSSLLVPGVSSTVRIRGNKGKRKVVRCLNCETCKKFPINPNHQLWFEHEKCKGVQASTKANTNQRQNKIKQKPKISPDVGVQAQVNDTEPQTGQYLIKN